MGVYEKHCLPLHSDIVDHMRRGAVNDLPPIHVRLEMTDVCNLSCVFCWSHNPVRRASLPHMRFSGGSILPWVRIRSLIDELAELGTRAISFTGFGEPLCHPQAQEAFEHVMRRGLRWAVTTNMGAPLSPAMIETMTRATWIRCSLNAATSETHRAVSRPCSDRLSFDATIRSLRALHAHRRKSGSRCRLNVSYVVCPVNAHELRAAAKLVKDCGADSIVFRMDTPFERTETPLACPADLRDAMQRAKDDLDSDTFSVDIPDFRLKDVNRTGYETLLCYYANATTYIDAYGDVYPCCYTRCDQRFARFNIMDRAFRQIWESDERRSWYCDLVMANCPPCPHGRDNQFMHDILCHRGDAEELRPTAVADQDLFI